MTLNQSMPLEFVKSPTKREHRPLPMKMCPPHETLTGLRVDVLGGPNPAIKSVTAIRCSSVSESSSTWYKTNPASYTSPPADAADFVQHLGALSSTTSATSKDLVCGTSEILTGLRMYVPNSSSTLDNDALRGLGVVCQGGLF